jgi:hypothetical protein
VFQAGNATRNPTFMITIGIPDKIRHIPNHNEQVEEEHTLIIHKTIHTHIYIYVSKKENEHIIRISARGSTIVAPWYPSSAPS